MSNDKIKVLAPGARQKFELWIKVRGGVQVWDNVNLSDPGAGRVFTPTKTLTGEDYPKPRWSVGRGETITDIDRFRFVKSMKEVKRFHVAVRRSSNGLMLKCNDASSRRIERECGKVPEGYYRFDYSTQEVIIEVPVWEE